MPLPRLDKIITWKAPQGEECLLRRQEKWRPTVQEILSLLRYPIIHYSAHRNPLVDPSLRKTVQSAPSSYLFQNHFNLIFPFPPMSPRRFLPFRFPSRNPCAFLISPKCAVIPLPSHPPWFHDLQILGKMCKLWTFSLCKFLRLLLHSLLSDKYVQRLSVLILAQLTYLQHRKPD